MAEQEPGYAEAMAELDDILGELERDDLDVDVLADRVKRASELIGLCRERIARAQTDVDQIVVDLESFTANGVRAPTTRRRTSRDARHRHRHARPGPRRATRDRVARRHAGHRQPAAAVRDRVRGVDGVVGPRRRAPDAAHRPRRRHRRALAARAPEQRDPAAPAHPRRRHAGARRPRRRSTPRARAGPTACSAPGRPQLPDFAVGGHPPGHAAHARARARRRARGPRGGRGHHARAARRVRAGAGRRLPARDAAAVGARATRCTPRRCTCPACGCSWGWSTAAACAARRRSWATA